MVSGHVIIASCHYFTIRTKEEVLGQLTKKGGLLFTKRKRERGREGGKKRGEGKDI